MSPRHTSNEYRITLRDYRTQRLLLKALTETIERYEQETGHSARELRSLEEFRGRLFAVVQERMYALKRHRDTRPAQPAQR